MTNDANRNSYSGQGQKNTGDEPLDLGQSKYDFRSLVFPNDLGMDDNGHYMIININVPSDAKRTEAQGAFRDKITELPGEASKVDRLRFGQSGTISKNEGSYWNPFNLPEKAANLPGIQVGGNENAAYFALQRKTMRIAESIALHMPTPLVYNTHNAYEEISLTALGFKLGAAGLTAIASAVTAGIAGSVAKAIGAGEIVKTVTNAVGKTVSTASKIMQNPINPAVEILFSNTLVRQFTLEVMMAPRNERESISLHNIIKTLRFHAAPEIAGAMNLLGFELGAGLFWIPPAEFDITFFNKGVENMNILRMNTCVMERIEVDYSPTGVYSTFRNGHPVAVRLSLGLRELEPIHKKRILQGF